MPRVYCLVLHCTVRLTDPFADPHTDSSPTTCIQLLLMTDSPDAPSLLITSPDGARARVYLDGAHMTSWIPAGGEEQLFVSANAMYGPGQSIRGGIPVCWPQFGAFGPIRSHGFARLSRWAVSATDADTPEARATFVLTDTDATRAEWPHAFRAELTVAVGGATLEVTLTLTNTGDQAFVFTGALHPYFRVHDAFACAVDGLAGTVVRDGLDAGRESAHAHDVLCVTGMLDRIYYGARGPIVLRDPHRALQLTMRGFTDIVVWNPGIDGVRAKTDFAAGDEQHMLCVEPALVRPAVTLAPGATWSGAMTARVLPDAGHVHTPIV